jgi:hypothetical protein
MTQEALKLALEALENGDVPTPENAGKNLDAITAIKEALAQPEQAPTDELHSCPYAEEIHGNYEKVCDCDEERTRQCAQDI